jgi:uncharacterized BrkB/YihY/UPF0761 family membrane protein
MMAKHAREATRGDIALRDLLPRNMHPKARLRVFLAVIGTLLLMIGCIYLLTTVQITPDPDLATAAGINAATRNLLALGYVIGTAAVIVIIWYVMVKDCPLSPAAKANYDETHDKGMRGVVLAASIATAVANKGTGSSINAVAQAADNYFKE